MKRLIDLHAANLLYACLMFFYISCNSEKEKTQPAPATRNDSTDIAVVDKAVAVDSGILNKENIVFGDIRFGISRKQYYDIIKDSNQQVGIYHYIFFPKFNAIDQLYKLSIRSNKRENWDSTCKKIANLNQKIFQYYSTANYANQHFSYLNSKPGFIEVHLRWNIGVKEIITGAFEEDNTIGDDDYVSVYRAVCTISNKILMNNLGHENDKQEDSASRFTPGKF